MSAGSQSEQGSRDYRHYTRLAGVGCECGLTILAGESRARYAIASLGCECRLTISEGCERSDGSADDFRLCL